MKRFFSLIGLMLVAVMACPQPAEASLWDWLQELSGPGPFHGRFNYALTLKCEGSGVFRPSRTDVKSPTTCVFFDQRFFKSEADDRFDSVNVVVTEIGPSIRLHPAVEVGAGIGVINFTSEGKSATRLTGSFPRLVFNPFLALPKLQTNKHADWGFFKIYFRESIIVGGLSEEDFSAKPGTRFSVRHERVRSMGFIIDVVPLAHLLKH
jgi:hypothetical protein